MSKNVNATINTAADSDMFARFQRFLAWEAAQGNTATAAPSAPAAAKQAKAGAWLVPAKRENTELNGVELIFDGKPVKALRTICSTLGFRWNGDREVWYMSRKNPLADVSADTAIQQCREACKEQEGAKVQRVTASPAPAPAPAPVASPAPAASPAPVASAPAPAPAKQSGALAAGMHFVDARVFTIKSFPDNDHVRIADETGKESTCKLQKDERGYFITVNKRRASIYRK